MCHRPTQDDITRRDAAERASFTGEQERGRPDGHSRDPWVYPEPRGNGGYDRREAERSEEKLAVVLGH